MNKIKIRNFVDMYNRCATDNLKEYHLKGNLEIIKYIPFVKKDTLVNHLVNVTTYKYEDCVNEDGSIGRRRTNMININSTIQYLLFCRLLIENYTNLEVETDGFYEEYDMLKQSGLLDKLIVGTETSMPLIPIEEISELRTMVEMRQKDALTNYATPQAYISNQVERVSTILGVTLKPALEKIYEKIGDMTDEDIDKLGNKLEKLIKRVK